MSVNTQMAGDKNVLKSMIAVVLANMVVRQKHQELHDSISDLSDRYSIRFTAAPSFRLCVIENYPHVLNFD